MNVTDMMGIQARLAELRKEAALLTSQINTAFLPPPTFQVSPHRNFPGPEWAVGRRRAEWRIHTIPGDHVLYVHHPGDMPGDVQPMELDFAQDVGMALLSGCQWVNLHYQPTPAQSVLDEVGARRGRKTPRPQPK